ncbi:MAG: marine proteobacterial sortase target protein, partial [Sulfitobacter sp.]
LETNVEISVNGPIARVSVTQRFENPTEGWVEGIYVFPLPEDSAVDTLKMRVGDRLIEGIIKPREEAREIFEQAKREGKKAALLEQQRDNIFTNNIANIGPGEVVIVNIEYQQTVRQDSGLFSLRFPMVVAPRYSPQPIVQTVDFTQGGKSGFGVVDPVPDREAIAAPILDPRENAKINPVTLTVKLAAGFPLGEVTSPFHEMISENQDEATRILTLKNDSVPADRDFELSWRSKGEAPNAALFRETVDGKTYVLAFVTPPEIDISKLPKKDREVIFVIDNSGSMAGESMDQAKLALEDALSRLKPSDKFNIVRFDDTYELLFNDAVLADNETRAVALRFVRGLQADGGTEMLPALRAALVDRNTGDTDRIRQVVFITDGAIGNEQQLFDAIAQGKGRSRVFTIGIGSAPNSFFMNRAAEMGRGTFTHIGAIDQVKSKMGSFFAKLENPVMTGLAVQGVGAVLSEVSPNPLPDLYKGEPIIVAAVSDSPNGTLKISGDYAGQPWLVNMDLAQATEGLGIGKLWARRKISSLEAGRSYGNDVELINKQVEEVAMAHHLVSSRTSLVAVDVKVTRPQGEEVTSTKLPLNLPAGWDADKWFEDDAATAPT